MFLLKKKQKTKKKHACCNTFLYETGSRVSIRVRQAYFDALTRQDISFHEIETSAKLNGRLTTECFAIQEAIGTKYALSINCSTNFQFYCLPFSFSFSAIFRFFIQTVSQFVIGLGLAFVYSWRLTLVLFATMPALLIIGAVQGYLMQGQGGQEADPYVDAGSFSQEVITNIRTVLAFPTLITSKLKEYNDLVDLARPIATKRMVYVGIGLGGFMYVSNKRE